MRAKANRILSSISDVELYWLAGLYEGEGTFCKGVPSSPSQCILCIEMKDLDVIERVVKVMGVPCKTLKPKKVQHSTTYRVRIRGYNAVQWMNRLFPLMGKRRRQQILAAIESYETNVKRRRVWKAEEVFEIKNRLVKGETVSRLASEYNVSYSAVHDLKTGKRWNDIGSVPEIGQMVPVGNG